MLHNVGIHIRASTQRYQEFKDAAGRSLPEENDTRWNSWYRLIKAARELKKHVNRYVADHSEDLDEDALSEQTSQQLDQIQFHPFDI